MKQYTDLDPEIIEARAKIEAAYARLRTHANGPQPDPEALLRMGTELKTLVDSCPPSWIHVSNMEPAERARILAYLKKCNEGITSTPNPRTAWTDGT